MPNVRFVALADSSGDRDGEGGWRVNVDGVTVIDSIDDLDVSNNELNPLWAALGVEMQFDYD